jgi:hypothetical protein
MEKPLSYAEVLEHNRNQMSAGRKPGQLSHIEVTHHMTNGGAEMVRVEPGKMAAHMADCPHCGASGAPEAE